MKILLAVPSKNRIETLFKYTWAWLENMNMDYRIFVEPQDYDSYKLHFQNVVSIGKDNQGLGYAKLFIKNFASENGYDLVFKLDDDIRGFTNFRTKLSADLQPAHIKKILDTCIDTLTKYQSVKAIAFPYSFEMYEKGKGWENTKRLQTAYIIKTDAMLDNPAINVFEDFATGLNIIAKGGLILKYGLAGIDMGVKVGGGTGGHQSYDRFEQAKIEIELLREIYPPLKGKLVDKPWRIEPDLRSVRL